MLLFSEIPNWTEEQLDEMGSDEHDFLEFKCSRYLEEEGEINPFFLDGLSKQLSAFSNGAGGRIVIGIDDHGNVDGGVKTNLKGGGTRSWLEDVIHTLVSPRLAEFNVFEVLGSQETSKILPGHAVYVLEIAESKDAPHQARDHRYYLRIAGKSRPMGHVHVQDVIRRTRNPRVTLARMGPYGEPELDEGDVRGRRVFVGFRILLVNQGATLANHVGAEVILPRQLVGGEVRKRILHNSNVHAVSCDRPRGSFGKRVPCFDGVL